MRLRVLRPVGEALPPVKRGADPVGVIPEDYEAIFVQSGTAALALALKVAAERAGPGRHRVLLPGYGCPDLVAATVFAGLEPCLVDTAPDSPFLSMESLEAWLDERVLAVVGVHFLGLAEDIGALRKRCDPLGITVIEDSAQKIPSAGGIDPAADLVVLSFGRGKPAGALGGGALLLRPDAIDRDSVLRHVTGAAQGTRWVGLRRLAYNTAIRPGPYALVSRLPGLELGVTRYQALADIEALDAQLTDCAVATWRHAVTERAASQASIGRRIQAVIQQGRALRTLAHVTDQPGTPLLRCPVLARDLAHRDRLHDALSREGLGSSKMYGAALADISGLPPVNAQDLDNARKFADRLFTLPTHGDVGDSDLEKIASVLPVDP